MSNVVNFPRHLSTPPSKMDSPTFLEWKYEKTFNEPWKDLEDRVLARNPEYRQFLIELENTKENKKWWQIWKRGNQ